MFFQCKNKSQTIFHYGIITSDITGIFFSFEIINLHVIGSSFIVIITAIFCYHFKGAIVDVNKKVIVVN